jgi:DNA replication protein DnaC
VIRPHSRCEAHVLVEQIADASIDGTRKDTMNDLATVPLLIVDDLGMRKLPPTAAEDLLELVMRRYKRASTLFRFRVQEGEGRRPDLEKMFGYANHVGLYGEELGPRAQHLGNFPQAFTHVALISAAYDLDRRLSAAGHSS